MKIDHIGYAVNNIEKAIQIMENLGYTFEPTVDDMDRNVRIAFGQSDSYRVELVSPLDRAVASPVDPVLSKNGPTPYHICYRSENLERDVEKLKAGRFKVTIPPAPAVAFSGRRVVFLYSLSTGLIEIVEE